MQGEASTRLGFTDYFRVELAVGQSPRGGAVARAGAGASEGVGIRRFRHHPRPLRSSPTSRSEKARAACLRARTKALTMAIDSLTERHRISA